MKMAATRQSYERLTQSQHQPQSKFNPYPNSRHLLAFQLMSNSCVGNVLGNSKWIYLSNGPTKTQTHKYVYAQKDAVRMLRDPASLSLPVSIYIFLWQVGAFIWATRHQRHRCWCCFSSGATFKRYVWENARVLKTQRQENNNWKSTRQTI